MGLIFRRLPLLLAATAELPNPATTRPWKRSACRCSFTRTRSGEVRAFVNMCSHRGARLREEGCGNAQRFTCPYHAWTYSPEGDLVAVYSAEQFGEIDKSQHGLTPLPCLEKAG